MEAVVVFPWVPLTAIWFTLAYLPLVPLEDVSPIASYYATVSRKLADGSVFYPDQRMSRLEALKSYTINAAQAAFEEESKGTLKVGKYADVVVLSKDILTAPDAEIPATQVKYTVVAGKVKFKQ